ncbi:MAG TPA: M48 family metalloprotease [Dongiaceae bacterium]|nr:M48 family metalloprotease [Dongiaceae bacterium]
MERVPCPRCGALNAPRAEYCELCQERFPAPVGGRALAPPPAAAAPPAAPARALAPPTAPAAAPAGPIGRRRDFRAEQAANRWRSWLLMSGFVLVLALLGGSIGGAYGTVRAGLLLSVALGLASAGFAWFGGSSAILAASDAREVTPAEAPMLHNVVEELAIASGLPKPRLYIMETAAPNAFATGRSPATAAIAVTRGLLDKLDRDQLQGVLAHEMSHIRNLDVRFATIAGILVAGVAMVADAHLRSTRWVGVGGRRGGSRGGGVLVVLIALVMALLAPLASRLLQMAISRRRELYADASAVEMTRNPLALAGALRRIGSDPAPLEAANRATQHLFIANPVRAAGPGASALFSTHPPIESRIRILESMA